MDANVQPPYSKRRVNDDITNSMPFDILLLIISFLSCKEIVRTSVLSKKWKLLLTSISNIDVDTSKDVLERENLLEVCSKYLDYVFAIHDDSAIRKVRIRFDRFVDSVRLKSWIQAAISHNVQELDLDLVVEWETWPCWIFTCPSLVVLKLCSRFSSISLSTISTRLSNLKTLHLSGVSFNDESSFQGLFNNFPILNELALVYCNWEFIKNVTVSISTLRILRIVQDSSVEMSCLIQISAPNLTDLCLFGDLSVIFCMSGLCSLNYATIVVAYKKGLRDILAACHHATSLLSVINNVKYLDISSDNFMLMKDADDLLEQLPMFLNLTRLEVTGFSSGHGGVLIDFLWKAPNLEFISLKESFDEDSDSDSDTDTDDESGVVEDAELTPEKVPPELTPEKVPSCFNSSLKMLTVSNFLGSPEVMELVGFVFAYATVLEKVNIYFSDYLSEDDVKEVKDELKMLPKGSESCEFVFH